ncbi:TolC family protein [Aliikangiella marina]|nr:TolC family protein [Aliikangiella marina]
MSITKFTCVCLLMVSFGLQAKDIRVAIIKDGPTQKEFLSESVVQQEIVDLLGSEFSVSFVDSNKTTANWTLAGINRVIDENYRDPNVDILVTIGVVSSNEVATRKRFPKPTIAAVTIDPVAQSFPIEGNRSGKNNFTYIADVKEPGIEVTFFRDFVGQSKFAVLIEPLLAESWPEFSVLLETAAKNYNVEFIQVPVKGSPGQVVDAIPADAEAVLVGPLAQYSRSQVRTLANRLIDRKLPSYTFAGEIAVEDGLMVTTSQMSQAQGQMSRRVAINIQRILLGTNASELTVNMQFNSRVIYNQATGLAIGFAPRWDDVIDAKIINEEEFVNRRAFTVQEAVKFSLQNNLNLQVASFDVELAKKDVDIARSNLYPSMSLSAAYNQINEEQVIPGANPEKRSDAQLNFSQLIYADSAWANFEINEALKNNQLSLYQSQVLDTAQQAATAYLNLLRAKADEEIRRANLEVTRKNLDLAENRLRVGSSGKSDILRWKSQQAIDRKNLFASEANRRNAELELARVMNLEKDVLVDARQPEVSDLLSILSDERFEKFVGNQIHWQAFQEFYKLEALKNSPELKSFESLLEVNQRELLTNQRGNYIPDVNFVAQAGRNIDQSGLGAVSDVEKNTWSVGVQASLSFDLSGQRRNTISRKQIETKQIQLRQKATAQQILTNTGQALFNVGSSYPSIELSHASAEAAMESLTLVRSAYANGKVSISDLLDAQNNALSARLLAADAEYAFLQDYIRLMRAAGDFKPLLDGQYSNEWFDRLIQFFRTRGIATSSFQPTQSNNNIQ